jgi:hypothetical protein
VGNCGSFGEVLPVAATIVGAMTGGGIGFLTARYSTYRTARAAAASKLRAAFIPELVAMKFDRHDERFDVDKLLRAAFPRHAQAVEEYRFYIRPRNREAYEKVWREYYEVGGRVRFFDYMMGENQYERFESRVKAILKFAE